MAFKQKFEYRQKLVFNQALQQSVKILELPMLELKSVVEAELAENPAIEEVMSVLPPAQSAEQKNEKNAEDEPQPSLDTEYTAKGFDTLEQPLPARSESLADFLAKQLRINAENEEQIRVGMLIIQNIDENGYLRAELSTLASQAQLANEEEMLKALKLIQTFEPYGVAARDLKECLLIQLNKKTENCELAIRLVENYLEELADKNIEKLCKKLKCDEEKLTSSLAVIHSLEPKPGRGFAEDETTYVIPDITIEEKNDELVIAIKDDAIPIVRVNPIYKNMLKSKKVNEETKGFIRDRILGANNLIRAIQNRKNTLVKIVSLIAETQKEAILEGVDKLKPLSLKEVAQLAELHESTVSRVVANKYIQTPAGIFPLKDLFSLGLKTSEGVDIASERIKAKIQDFIENEDKKKPLKDQELANMIKDLENTALARRTIAKYRESLNIPTASKRRKTSL